MINRPGGGGGGGGYSGGGGARKEGEGGGGGGSYVNPAAITSGTVPVAGIQSGNGSVTIERLEYEPGQPVNKTFDFQGNTFQYFTAPATGYYLISARGAQGGGFNNFISKSGCNDPLPNKIGGKGAHLQGYVVLKKGQVYRIAVGGMGEGITWNGIDNISQRVLCGSFCGGGGGGASSVVAINDLNFSPIMFAGGGGGASFWMDGEDATTSESGTNTKIGTHSTNGGTNGNGGNSINGNYTGRSGGGGGYRTDGETYSSNTLYPYSTANNRNNTSGGQAYAKGNYGQGNLENTGKGGWGGGGSGSHVVVIGASAQNPDFYHGSGGGGGGYSGGAGATFNYYTIYDSQPDTLLSGGGGGGSYSTALGGRADSSGVNTGNGLVTIYGPNVSTENITVLGSSYTWPANGNTYFQAGAWIYVDKDNFVVRVLNLSFGTSVNCSNYTTNDTTVVSAGSYIWYRNGRLYTENTVDSFMVGCDKYILRLTVSAPNTNTAPINFAASVLYRTSGEVITSRSEAPTNVLTTDLGYDWNKKNFIACINKTSTFKITEVPFATSYKWVLPEGATGSSSTNSITLNFNNSFNGGSVCLVPLNDIGAGDTLCVNVDVAPSTLSAPVSIDVTPAPGISGYYAVTPLPDATDYTWSVSGDKAKIISGQGTPRIQLEALPGFTEATLSVAVSNCSGTGQSTQIQLRNEDVTTSTRDIVRPEEIPAFIYPNPSDGRFTLSTPLLKSNAILEVYSIDGRIVYRKQIPANTTQSSIVLPNTSSGLYHLRLSTGKGLKTLKMVKY